MKYYESLVSDNCIDTMVHLTAGDGQAAKVEQRKEPSMMVRAKAK